VYEGFYQAKVSGRCAAEAILAAREQGQFDARGLAGYKRRWEEQLDEINLRPGRAAAYILYDTGKLDTVANALLKAIKKEQAEGGTKIQNLFLQNMIAPTYSRANDIIWTKAVVGEMGLGDKAVMLPRFLRAAFIK
jgi:flavin-dependent dehydrogenase